MSYIGNEPITAAFLTDTFSGNGSTVAFTMSVAPANTSSILVAVTGVVQDPSTYSVSGTTLTFSAAPPSGTSNISVRYLGIPASGVTTTAYRTVTDSTATAGQTTFTIPSYTVGYVDVYRNGSRLAAADYTATTGTTVVLASAASAGDTITTESFYVSSVLNAIQQYNGLSVNQVLTTPTANTLTSASGSNLQLQTNGGTTALTLDTAQNAGLGVTPSAWGTGFKALQVSSSALINNGANDTFLGANYYFDGTNNRYVNTDFASAYGQVNGVHAWYYAPSGTAGNAISFTQAMTIDANGRLTVPNQPAFKAHPSSNVGVSNAVITFNSTSGYGGFNTGGYFNTSTYRFTAPVAGRYHFSVVLNMYNVASGNYPWIRVNGSNILGGDTYATGSIWTTKTLSITLSLSVNDYVDVYWEGSGTVYNAEANQWSSFSGFLIG